MEALTEYWTWTVANYKGIFIVLATIYPTLELITRLTPTKKDDTFLERAGALVRKLMDILKIPNLKKKEVLVVNRGGKAEVKTVIDKHDKRADEKAILESARLIAQLLSRQVIKPTYQEAQTVMLKLQPAKLKLCLSLKIQFGKSVMILALMISESSLNYFLGLMPTK